MLVHFEWVLGLLFLLTRAIWTAQYVVHTDVRANQEALVVADEWVS